MTTTRLSDIAKQEQEFPEWFSRNTKGDFVTEGDVDEYEGAQAWIQQMRGCPRFGIGGGKGYQQDWLVMEDILSHFPFHTSAIGEYQMLLYWWLPKIFTGYKFENCSKSERHLFTFGQVRYFPPTHTTPSGTVSMLDMDQTADMRTCLSMHVVVDIEHVRHFYTKPLTLLGLDRLMQRPPASTNATFEPSSHIPLRTSVCFVDWMGGALGVEQRIDDQHLQFPVTGPAVDALLALAKNKTAKPTVLILVDRAKTYRSRATGLTLWIDAVVRSSNASGVKKLLYDHERLLQTTEVYVNYQVPLVDMPLMVGSLSGVPGFGEPKDLDLRTAGSIIVNGNAQQITDQIQLAINEAFVFKDKTKWLFSCECRSLDHKTPFNSTSTLKVHLTITHDVVVHVPRIGKPTKTKKKKLKPTDIPLSHLLTFIGVTSCEEFRAAATAALDRLPANLGVWLQRLIDRTRFEEGVDTDFLSRHYSAIVGKPPGEILELFREQFLPHCPDTSSKLHFFLGILSRFAIAVVLDQWDDRDAQESTWVASSGSTIALLHRQLAKRWEGKIEAVFEKAMAKDEELNAASVADYKLRSGSATYHIKTKHFSVTSSDSKQGSTQDRIMGTTAFSSRAQMAMNNKTLKKEHKHKGPRSFKNDNFGKMCPVTTPEGGPTGLSNSQPVSTHLSRGVDVGVVQRIVLSLPSVLGDDSAPAVGVDPSVTRKWNRLSTVHVNGHLVGKLGLGTDHFVKTFVTLRRRGIIPYCISVTIENNGCAVRCGPGRILTPYYVAERAHMLEAVLAEVLSGGNPSTPDRLRPATLPGGLITELSNRGIVEWLDSYEQRDKFVAGSRGDVELTRPAVLPESMLDWEPATHALIVAASVLSPTASLIPWIQCNQTPRAIYFVSQFKASMGFSNPDAAFNRVPAKVFSLNYPQRALVRTRFERVLETHFDRESVYSQSLIVAWMTVDFVIEDAIVVAKGAAERGVGMHYEYNNQSFTTQDKHVIFQKPGPNTILRKLDSESFYAAIGDDGLPVKGRYVKKGDIILGKVRPIYSLNEQGQEIVRYRCCSAMSNHSGYVSNVSFHRLNSNMGRVVTVQLREHCYLQPGDKLSNRHGQKGCVAILIPDVDMPFNSQGIRPDIIVNPHSFTSRMTIGCMLEALGCKAAAVNGESFVDASAWTDPIVAVGRFRHALMSNGYHPMGQEQLFSGHTGQPIAGSFFMAPVNTMFLTHKVKNKAYARGRRGPVDSKTRQPTQGRAQYGGLRTGEMEEEILQQYGSIYFGNELNKLSDPHIVYVCKQCHLIVSPPPAVGLRTGGRSAEDMHDVCQNHPCQFCRMRSVVAIDGTWSCYGMLVPIMTCLNVKTELEVRERS
jgi:DNA-directed RNA polymerase beta subunit